ncbi:colicin E1 family microcin immunity protein [Providencia rettgeri]|uniref:colicin E1 family microcin immunity protein n=1 Tax=Providencia rettgeri TaxID=587 RepID=UPI001B35F829|nr:colicin E1 family microcin immunity protein [Providencia rettgeri]MBQ0365688.1 colicin transporter [Providencia rettgeri]
MNKKYYIQNMGWGWFMGALLLYSYLGSELKYKSLILFISVIGIIIYPFAKWAVESFFLMFTTREFWNRGLFMDTAGKAGGLAVYGGVVFLLSIPITLIFIITVLIRRLSAK